LSQVSNGLSHVTEDLTIAKFLVETGFPEGFTDENNSDPNGDEDLKFTEENI
jgi:hypothetical protein